MIVILDEVLASFAFPGTQRNRLLPRRGSRLLLKRGLSLVVSILLRQGTENIRNASLLISSCTVVLRSEVLGSGGMFG